MTNAQIIFNESMKLMSDGIIKGSGQFGNVLKADGTTERVELPEDIHTFARWKAFGRQVKKGEKAKASILIWKAKQYEETLQDENGNEITEEAVKMFMKKAFFFTLEQTEPINA